MMPYSLIKELDMETKLHRENNPISDLLSKIRLSNRKDPTLNIAFQK